MHHCVQQPVLRREVFQRLVLIEWPGIRSLVVVFAWLTEFLQRHLRTDLSKAEIDRVYRLALVRTYLDRVDVREHGQVITCSMQPVSDLKLGCCRMFFDDVQEDIVESWQVFKSRPVNFLSGWVGWS